MRTVPPPKVNQFELGDEKILMEGISARGKRMRELSALEICSGKDGENDHITLEVGQEITQKMLYRLLSSLEDLQ